jgi:hypothetical protein
MWTIPFMTHRRKSLPLVFIVACPRSGTTLLQSLLASHSEIISFPETKFFEKAFPRKEPSRKFLGLVSRQLYPQLQSFFINDLKRPDIAKQLPKDGSHSWYTTFFFNLLSEIAQEQGKKIVLEKTPEHINHLKTIDECLPQAKVIHVVRNGPDVVASLYALAHSTPSIWNEFQDLEVCLERWINKTKRSFMKTRNKANHVLVRYEHLTQDPQQEIQKLCNFLNINFEHTMLENYGVVSHSLCREHEYWKQKVADPIKRQRYTQFDRALTEEQKSFVLDSIEKAGLSDTYISPLAE